jgi:hypothetical protein
MRTDTRTNTQTHSLAGSQIRTHMYACVCVRTCTHIQTSHIHARACAQNHTRTKIHARTRTFPLTRADGARCAVCASAFRCRSTPLHYAARRGHAEVVAALLAHGADVHAKNKDGCGGPLVAICGNGVCASAFHRRETPLNSAAYKGHADVVAALLTHGADVHSKDKWGYGGRSLFSVGVHRAGRGRPGRDRCNAVPDAPTDARANHSRKHTRMNAAVCMRPTDARSLRHTHVHAQPRGAMRTYAHTTSTAARTPPDSSAHMHRHTLRNARTHVVRMHGCIFICVRGRARMRAQMRAHTPTRTPPAVRQSRTHSRAGAVTLACARTHVRVAKPVRIAPHTRARTQARAQTNALAGSRIRTHMDAHTRSHTHACARASSRTNTDTRTNAHAHVPTYTRRRARAALCARARSTAGTRRSMRPLPKGTQTWWRRCSRTAPMCTQRTLTGAAAGRYFGQRSACAAPAVADRDGIDATHIGMHAHTQTLTRTQKWKDACCAYASVYLPSYAYGSARACAHTCARAHACAHTSRSPTSARAHSHAGAVTHAGGRVHTHV